ncbi:MAG: hypothetical protein HPY71_08990 [Firmicutes bacterium]|nr:hypothetical protein [Bacillota bacterium]
MTDPLVRTTLEKYFSRYLYTKLRPGFQEVVCESLSVISPGQGLNVDDIENVLRVARAVAFSAIMDDPWERVSTDTWAVYFQNYSPGHSGITIGDSYFSSVDLVKFLRPYSAYEPLVPFCGNKFLSGLGEIVGSKGEEIQRIFTALEWFCRAWTRNEMVSDWSRIVCLVIAFESLFDFDNKFEFMSKVKEIVRDPAPINETRKIPNQDCREKTEREMTRSLVEWWAYDLYNLRNAIVHGRTPDPSRLTYKGNKSHLIIAKRVFEKAIKRCLVELNLYPMSEIEEIFESEPIDQWLSQADE